MARFWRRELVISEASLDGSKAATKHWWRNRRGFHLGSEARYFGTASKGAFSSPIKYRLESTSVQMFERERICIETWRATASFGSR
jgi:hypothetical protein